MLRLPKEGLECTFEKWAKVLRTKQNVMRCANALAERDQGRSELGSLQLLAAQVASLRLWFHANDAFCKCDTSHICRSEKPTCCTSNAASLLNMTATTHLDSIVESQYAHSHVKTLDWCSFWNQPVDLNNSDMCLNKAFFRLITLAGGRGLDIFQWQEYL